MFARNLQFNSMYYEQAAYLASRTFRRNMCRRKHLVATTIRGPIFGPAFGVCPEMCGGALADVKQQLLGLAGYAPFDRFAGQANKQRMAKRHPRNTVSARNVFAMKQRFRLGISRW